jgi:hypothetical protein
MTTFQISKKPFRRFMYGTKEPEDAHKLNQTVLELDFRAVKFLFFPRRDLNPHH